MVWFFGFGFLLYAGGRDLLLVFAFVFGFQTLRWHPRYVSSLQASPLCGAAPTFLCRRKEK
ncbi:conserved hypothetical protein [Paraburkholderia caribensis]|nr:conserved hypothetical protein [Paraburkholderia caribensis]